MVVLDYFRSVRKPCLNRQVLQTAGKNGRKASYNKAIYNFFELKNGSAGCFQQRKESSVAVTRTFTFVPDRGSGRYLDLRQRIA